MKKTFLVLQLLVEFLFSQECRIWLRMALKPLAVFGLVCLLFWIGGQVDRHIAHAATQTLACPADQEQNGGLCYPLCQDDYYGDGPVCYKNCPSDYKSDSHLCFKVASIFAKASYGRGAGVSLTCAANQEGQSGLCYPRCNPGYYGVGPVCWQFCKPGYTDHGATCFRHIFDFYGKPTYGRGAGGAVSACAAGLQRNGSLCYPPCRAGFAGAGPVCFQQCPADYKDDGAICRKDAVVFATPSYGRGAGTAMNTVPVAEDETVRTPKDTPAHLGIFFHDANDDNTTFILVQDVSHGQFGANTYTPNPGFVGTDTLVWKVTDGKNESNVAVSTIIVGNPPPNTAPVAIDRTISLNEDTPITVTVTCTDVNNDALLYQLIDKPEHGAYEWVPPNHVVYTPTINFAGVDHFTFRAYDGQDFSQTSTVTLTVAAINDTPLALAQSITTTRNNNTGIPLFASDAENDPITYTVVSSPTHGFLSGAMPNLLYTPEQNFVGADSFQFQARDPQGAATMAQISITVQPSNTAPLAASQIVTTSEASAVALTLAASDAENDPITYTVVTSPTHGTLAGDAADWVYTPNADFTGIDSFTFKANDGQADSAVTTVTLHVTAAPAATSIVGIIYEDSNANGQPDANDNGVSGLLVTLTSHTLQAAGTPTTFTTQTDAIGAWRLDDVPIGEYTLQVASSSSVQVEAPLQTTLTVGQRGVQQLQPASVKVTGRAVFLPVVMR